MATLTETAYFTRKAINYGIISLVVLIVLKIVLTILGNYWAATHPPAPPPPTVVFGRLPQINFPLLAPQPIASSSAFTYTIETVEGQTVTLPTTGKVYYMPQITANVLALDRAKEKANKLGFTADPVKLTPEIYVWTDSKNPWRTITMNIYTGNFSISYTYLADQTLLVDKEVLNLKNSFVEARNFLEALGIDTNSLETVDNINFQSDPTIGQYLKLSNSGFFPATSQSEADAVRINLPKKKLDDLPFVSVDPFILPVSFTFSGQRDETKRILLANYTNFPIEKEVLATYPLKSFNTALEALKEGSGFIASHSGKGSSVIIRKAYLAYFDSPLPQNFLQPVVVFEGDNSFIAYVSAVSSEWIK